MLDILNYKYREVLLIFVQFSALKQPSQILRINNVTAKDFICSVSFEIYCILLVEKLIINAIYSHK